MVDIGQGNSFSFFMLECRYLRCRRQELEGHSCLQMVLAAGYIFRCPTCHKQSYKYVIKKMSTQMIPVSLKWVPKSW